ncbi:MAG TPA: histidine kinase [Dysgonomonas sp.]|nr:histidine kinase [Dysgonomonas sp.]
MIFEKINNEISNNLKSKIIKAFGHIALLAVITILTVEMTYNDNAGFSRYEYSSLLGWIVYFVAIASVIYINMFVLVPRFLLKGKLTHYLLFIGLCVIISLFLIVVAQNLFFIFPTDDNTNTTVINIAGNIISIGLVIISTSIFSLFHGWKEYNQRKNELEASTVEAELKQLKSQINPHFLFNTINNANIKVENDPESAYSIITKLEDLLRYQLTDTPNEKICLTNDIAFLSDYLELEKTRRNRFIYSIKTDDSLSNIEVPPMLFIPFVENAVKHSLTTKGESIITISFSKEENCLHFLCENTKPAMPVKQKTGGLGLKNIKRRLDLLYGSAYRLDIIDLEEKYIVNLYLKI